ncbi:MULTISPECIES: ParA family protein [unclassified Phaeobacter]|uniref:ParA family protein n=1 Tax=unclassified Phaeobacter TaxID=2621772 RepID=UPI003A8540A5
MTYIIGMISQKGGAGKSTLARLFARELASGGFSVKIADLDTQQQTSALWASDRAENGLAPLIRAETFAHVKTALQDASGFDAYLLDGRPHADTQTLEIARASDLVVIPTNETKDSLRPAVALANSLADSGVPVAKIVFALTMTTSDAEMRAARDYLAQSDFDTLAGFLPSSTGYKKALDEGKALTETGFPTLNAKAETLAQSLIDRLASLTTNKKEVA